jgi:hypothetical protein
MSKYLFIILANLRRHNLILKLYFLITNKTSFLFRDYIKIIVSQIVKGVAIACKLYSITKSLLLKDSSKVSCYLFSRIFFMVFFFLAVHFFLIKQILISILCYPLIFILNRLQKNTLTHNCVCRFQKQFRKDLLHNTF